MGYFIPISCHSSTLLWMILALGMKWIEEALSCPTECSCNKWGVNCTGKKLHNFPTTIPLTTKKLILAQNNLTNLPLLTMSYLNELVHLDCSHNLITMDLDFSFPGLVKLTYLDLSFNKLSHITSFTFSQLSELLLLNLSGNPLMVEIMEWAFEKNSLLRYIDVRDCGLSYLSAETFQKLYRLRILGIKGNPWNCDCKFLTFSNWLTNTDIKSPDFENTTCSKPEKMQGLSLIKAKLELHYLCLLHLQLEDFIYICLLTFCVFLGGTLVAWLVGFGTVMYYHPVMRLYDEPEDEEYRMI
ncbi:leucine-rich repeat-containing protein 52 [Protobothrops mucrosquamatus]|uniref:leucine-rich repeat-containing protein 52 n=1 Tax=Protobothrops mucrosquamatus TaxID=103944 RepID=UPI0010FAF9D7|nr:leucine-rich repeat-containing protein 52 [Protobothrops mucrosquamatus]